MRVKRLFVDEYGLRMWVLTIGLVVMCSLISAMVIAFWKVTT